MRATFMPAATSFDRFSMVWVLGPMVQINLVCTAPRAGAKAPSCLKLMERLFSRAEPAPPLLPSRVHRHQVQTGTYAHHRVQDKFVFLCLLHNLIRRQNISSSLSTGEVKYSAPPAVLGVSLEAL